MLTTWTQCSTWPVDHPSVQWSRVIFSKIVRLFDLRKTCMSCFFMRHLLDYRLNIAGGLERQWSGERFKFPVGSGLEPNLTSILMYSESERTHLMTAEIRMSYMYFLFFNNKTLRKTLPQLLMRIVAVSSYSRSQVCLKTVWYSAIYCQDRARTCGDRLRRTVQFRAWIEASEPTWSKEEALMKIWSVVRGLALHWHKRLSIDGGCDDLMTWGPRGFNRPVRRGWIERRE